MARYAIGDIQGCYEQLMLLLDKFNFNPGVDTLYLVGDLVNRGHESLKVLKWAYKNDDRIIAVLGNHDIYLLARYNQLLKAEPDDTIQEIIDDKSAKKMIDWLRQKPLIHKEDDYILVHAGIYPKMDFNHLFKLNEMVGERLKANNYAEFLPKIYGNKPNRWYANDKLTLQMKFAINSCTRMRYLKTNNFTLDYKYKGDIHGVSNELIPWFKVDFDPSINKKIIFGHWASLGFYHQNKFISLDTGCVWGGKLTAINLDTFELFQV